MRGSRQQRVKTYLPLWRACSWREHWGLQLLQCVSPQCLDVSLLHSGQWRQAETQTFTCLNISDISGSPARLLTSTKWTRDAGQNYLEANVGHQASSMKSNPTGFKDVNLEVYKLLKHKSPSFKVEDTVFCLQSSVFKLLDTLEHPHTLYTELNWLWCQTFPLFLIMLLQAPLKRQMFDGFCSVLTPPPRHTWATIIHLFLASWKVIRTNCITCHCMNFTTDAFFNNTAFTAPFSPLSCSVCVHLGKLVFICDDCRCCMSAT